ncbi:MAG TPA: hypothetical protein VLB68_17980 [Pyrinomonadaceae bacterium]|nr:hypothetical protein [Pyrinomonadaceae bacterium]
MDLKESDYKVFRKLRVSALERYCERVLKDVERLVHNEKATYHERYLDLWKLLRNRDKTIAAFDGPRHSQAFVQLVNIDAENLLTEDELTQFSDELRDRIEGMRTFRHR